MLAVFDDTATIAHALAFEAALARAAAANGLIGLETAEAIALTCAAITIDPAGLAEEAALAGTLAIPLVARLRAALEGEAAAVVHIGATSQDISDSVLMLQTVAAGRLLDADLRRITDALGPLAERHAGTPAIGRTLLQDALPISFGLRIAHWHAGIASSLHRLATEIEASAMIQLGGAAGTRTGLGGRGAAIAAHMAQAFGLKSAPPWHARRIGVVAIATALAVVIGALGKMARDVSLLAQNAIGEAREPLLPGRGGSSAMAHKRNPTGCQTALSAAIRAPGLVAGILAAIPAEEERGLGGWPAEAPALVDLFLLAADAAVAIAVVAAGLEVDEARIASNLAEADIGTDIGESVALVAELLILQKA